MRNLEFKISAALKNIIGKDLISDDYIAIFELVKNSFDAYSSEVTVRFENVSSGKGKIIIIDNGKGMNYEDLIKKWLFVAYSAKKDGSEDENFDYRDKIHINRHFAGAKGIGRFSCDKLGSKLVLETRKQEHNAETHILYTDWDLFEKDNTEEFVNISIAHEIKHENTLKFVHGTKLEISGLRSSWDRPKYLKLKDSLSKLINPKESIDDQEFSIFLDVPEEIGNDSFTNNYFDKVNGKVKNFIFENLELKTTKITSSISHNGEKIITELYDGGTFIYKVVEKNNFKRLKDVECTLFYLNHPSKLLFAKKMGIPSVQYGHIFLYKNGFRVYPYGEPGEDPLKVDVRKAQGYNRYIGTREVMGYIDIYYDSDEISETSSRGDGLKKTKAYEEIEGFFWTVLPRLERYVVDVQRWGLSIEERSDDNADFQSRIIDLLARLTKTDDILDFKVAQDFLSLIENSQNNSAEAVVSNINRIAFESGNDTLIEQGKAALKKLREMQSARQEAERVADEERKRAEIATKSLKQQISENLFLKSINTSDYEEMISLLHHVGIYAGTIDTNLKGISLRVQNDIPLSNAELNNIIRLISFETKKIMNIVSFATKANFKLKTDTIQVDLNSYIREYIQNIIPTVTDKKLNIKIESSHLFEFVREIKPIELNIVIDNLISNAKKARAKNLTVILNIIDENFVVQFIDDGIGIQEDTFSLIYNLGFTTTDGAGIGLYHVKEIVGKLKGTITAENGLNNGAIFTLVFK